MTFQITKSIRQFSPFYPKLFHLRPISTCPSRPRLPFEQFSIPTMRPLQTRNSQLVQTTTRPYGIKSKDESEPDLISPPAFLPMAPSGISPHEQTFVKTERKVLRHILITFEAHFKDIEPQAMREALSGNFFKSEFDFVAHLNDLYESIHPTKRTGENLMRAVKAYAGCRAAILKKDPATTRAFEYSHSCLTMLPPEITRLSKLEILNLSNSPIESLPAIFSNPYRVFFPSLLSLNLNHTQNSSFGPLLSHCPKLQGLNLRGNNLEELPDELYELGSLKYVDLSENRFQDIPPRLFTLSLTHINLSQNQISELPSLFYDDISYRNETGESKLFLSLFHLDLSHNKLQKFLSYKAFPNLSTLNLSHNHLQSFHIFRFQDPAFRHLDLSSNCIKSIEADPKNEQHLGIQELDISYNPIEKIAPELLQEIPQLSKKPMKRESPSDMIGC